MCNVIKGTRVFYYKISQKYNKRDILEHQQVNLRQVCTMIKQPFLPEDIVKIKVE